MGPKPTLEKPDFSRLNTEHQAARQLLLPLHILLCDPYTSPSTQDTPQMTPDHTLVSKTYLVTPQPPGQPHTSPFHTLIPERVVNYRYYS